MTMTPLVYLMTMPSYAFYLFPDLCWGLSLERFCRIWKHYFKINFDLDFTSDGSESKCTKSILLKGRKKRENFSIEIHPFFIYLCRSLWVEVPAPLWRHGAACSWWWNACGSWYAPWRTGSPTDWTWRLFSSPYMTSSRNVPQLFMTLTNRNLYNTHQKTRIWIL